MTAQHTPGPWRWELSEQSKNLHLVGGRPQYDLTILEPIRWGMGKATFMIRDTAHDGMNIMHKLHERRDWIAPFPGREHHAKWLMNVTHPDMRLIAAAPELLMSLETLYSETADYIRLNNLGGMDNQCRQLARAAIAKATDTP